MLMHAPLTSSWTLTVVCVPCFRHLLFQGMHKKLAFGPGLESQLFQLLLSGFVKSVKIHTHLPCEDSVRSCMQSPGTASDTQQVGNKKLL